MELKYPRAIRGQVSDILRVGQTENGRAFLIDIGAHDPSKWMEIVHELVMHIATGIGNLGIRDEGGAFTREECLRIFSTVLLRRLRDEGVFETIAQIEGFDPKTGKSTVGVS